MDVDCLLSRYFGLLEETDLILSTVIAFLGEEIQFSTILASTLEVLLDDIITCVSREAGSGLSYCRDGQ